MRPEEQSKRPVADLRLIYDGDCPVCRRYVTMIRLNANYRVELVDARAASELYSELLGLGMSLDDGMVLELDGQRYFGDECIGRLALLSTDSGLFNRLNAWVFRSPERSRILYPWLVRGRNLVLRMLRVRSLADYHRRS